MNIFSHPTDEQAALRRARRLQFGGLLSVLISFVLSLMFGVAPILVYLAYPFLLVGLPLWTIGRTQTKKLAGAPRISDMVTAELKGFSDKYSLHHNAVVEGRRIDHLFITPNGIVVMDDNPALGPVTCTSGPKGDRWYTRTNLLDRMMGSRPAIGNPTLELDADVKAVRDLMSKSGKPDVPVRGVVVFTANPEIEIEESTYPAVPLNELKLAVRELQADMGAEQEDTRSLDTVLTSDDRRRLNVALGPAVSARPSKPASARS